MARSIYIASLRRNLGKSTVALGLVASLTKVVAKVGVFRPSPSTATETPSWSLLLARAGSTTPAEQCVGVTWDGSPRRRRGRPGPHRGRLPRRRPRP